MSIGLNKVLRIRSDTLLKDKPFQSGQGDMEVVPLKKGDLVEVNWVRESMNNHLMVSLKTPQKGKHNWYVFKTHIADDVYEVPYQSQLTFYRGMDVGKEHRICNTACSYMLLKYYKPEVRLTPLQFLSVVEKYGDTTDHSAQTKALEDFGIKSRFVYTLDWEDLETAGGPVVCGILHRGTAHQPTGGHMVVVIGVMGRKGVYCHDPYGSLLKGYMSAYRGLEEAVEAEGRGVYYPYHEFYPRWCVDGPKTGWGRRIVSP